MASDYNDGSMIKNHVCEESTELDCWCAEHRTFQVFDPDFKCSVNRLDPTIIIDDQDVTPIGRYKGGDASASGWTKWTYGNDLSFVSNGTDPTYDVGTPGFETEDLAVKFNVGDYFKGATTGYTNLGTNDIVIELIFQTGDLSTARQYLDKRNGTSEGWQIGTTSSGILYATIEDSSTNSATINSAALTDYTWYHALLFIDKSENSTNGSQWYLNGVTSGSGVNCSSVGDLDSSQYLYVAEKQDNTVHADIRLAYWAIWSQSNWHQGGTTNPTDWGKIAEERFAKYTGRYPSVAKGTVTPTTKTRAFEAYVDKVESSKIVLYYVGDEWLRQCHVQDDNGDDIYGFRCELAATNKLTYSEDFSNWTKIDTGDTVTTDDTACPDKRVVADALKADSTDGQHGLSLTATLTANDYCFSVFAKKGNKDWVKLENTTVSNCYAYFNVSTGALGSTPGSGVSEAHIYGPYYNDFYRVDIVFMGTAASHTFRALSASADNDDTFVGDGSTVNTYFWGAQVEQADYPSSPVITDGATATRTTDQLVFKGDDGNVTNNQKGMCLCQWWAPDYNFQGDPHTSAYLLNINDGGTAADMIALYISSATPDRPYFKVVGASTSTEINIVSGVDMMAGVIRIVKTTWASTKISLDVDGTEVDETTGIVIPNDLDEISIGSGRSQTFQGRFLIANLQICDEVLS
jgi:hypothetical protein